jgi:DNA helicase-2/ATP-dependent DNA helicase PcrA
MIDEYQDTNSAQYKLVKLLTGPHKNIAVVGDDWQSIYSWRGADFRNILNFEKDYQNCTVIKLEQNYRSTKNILDAAHAVISQNKQRSNKKLWTSSGAGSPVQILQVTNERTEAETIVRRIKTAADMKAWNYSDFAVLYRTNAQSRAIEEVFVHYGIPYRIVGGVRFYDRKEIKDVMAYLRLIYQPEDFVSFERVVNVPARGIGAKSLQNFNEWRTLNQLNLYDGLNKVKRMPRTGNKSPKWAG